MKNEIIYSSAYIEITKRSDGYYIESFKKGLNVDQFNKIIGAQSDIQIVNFVAIKDALVSAPREAKKFATSKEKILIEISGDELKAYLTLRLDESELQKPDTIKKIIEKLNAAGVVFGIKKDVLINGLVSSKPILIAEGIPPEQGKDSQIKMYELKDVRPEIKDDGNVDHYELSLINMVEKGAWLGERIDATPGVEGKTVKGNVIKPMPGKNYPLYYDRNSVKEETIENKTTLYATRTGAVYYIGDRIGVSNHLEIKGDVDFKTGNVDFDGFLTVKGTIEDNFSVVSTKDIEILGDYGVGGAKEIKSDEGSFYIKGGIAGKGKAIIRCKRNLFLKYVADADIYCDGSVHIGFYCLNSNITAKEVILESMKGQIIGGTINAEIRVVSSVYGAPSEKRTSIFVKGFDRKLYKEKLDKLTESILKYKQDIASTKQQLSIFSITGDTPSEKKLAFNKLNEKFADMRAELQKLEEEKKDYANYLKAKGEGEITILKKAFPNTYFEIKRISKDIQKPLLRTSFYYQDGELKEV